MENILSRMSWMKKLDEDDAINKKNKYENFKSINIPEHVMLSTIVSVVIILLVSIADFFFMKKRKTLELKLKSIYNFLIVGIILTIAEIFFVYWYNVETIYNGILESLDWKMTYERYLVLKSLNMSVPDVVHTEFKKAYEGSMKHITLILNIPIIVLSVLLISIASGRVIVTPKDLASIVINVLLLATTFGVTFVNLGTMQSMEFDSAEVVKHFDPKNEVHRFQEKFEITGDKKFLMSFLVYFIVLLVISVLALRFKE